MLSYRDGSPLYCALPGHTLDLPDGNRTSDKTLSELSIAQRATLVTKDSDFVQSFLLKREPWKLLLVSTGNITNNELVRIFELNLNQLVEHFETYDFVELNRTNLICHL
jgi:predicted nuclease of predicted toxin-antitoxin system